MKKIYVYIILAVVITVIIFAYINTQYVSGTSEDGKWKAIQIRGSG